jgi:hypothetical protein
VALASSLNSNYAQLGAANVFLTDQSVQGNLTANGNVSGNVVSATTSFNLGPNQFDSGTIGLNSSFLGFSKNSTSTGLNVLGVGVGAMSANTSGWDNTGVGYNALTMDADGSQNTGIGSGALSQTVGGCGAMPPPPPSIFLGQKFAAGRNPRVQGKGVANGNCTNPQGWGNTGVGYAAGQNNVSGIENTFVGYQAGPDSNSQGLIGATAIGANATVSQNYSVVLGQTGVTPGQLNASVGIGTAAPVSALDISVLNSGELGPTITLTNPSYAGGASSSIDFNTTPPLT